MSRPITTVITAAAGTNLVSLARAKMELGITDGNSDALLNQWIPEESSVVTDNLRRVLAQEKVSDEFRLSCATRRLSLTRRPIVSIDSIIECDVPLEADDYERDNGAGLIYRLLGDCRIPWWRRKIVVTYTAGYEIPDNAPTWAAKAVISCLWQRWAVKGRNPTLKALTIPGVVEEQYWVGSVSGDDSSLPPGVDDLLAPHRDVSV